MSNRHLVLSVLVASSLGAAVMPGPAFAADLDPPFLGSQQDPPDRVNFGTGWYIRGDLGVTQADKVGVSDVPSFDSSNTGANPSAPSILLNHSHDYGYDASLGAGYRFNNWLRADATADFDQPIKVSSTGATHNDCPVGLYATTNPASSGVTTTTTVGGTTTTSTTGATNATQTDHTVPGSCSPTNQASLNTYAVLANLYVDLGTWYGVTPYVGAGAGLGFGHYKASSTWYSSNNSAYQPTFTDPIGGGTYSINWNRNSSGQFYNLAWALMAGFSFDIFSHTKIDVGYRYINMGTINTGTGSLHLYNNELRAGVRYMIDE